MTINGPYVDAAFYNKPGATIWLCVECANDRTVPEENAIMYDEGPNFLRCHDCSEVIRDHEPN